MKKQTTISLVILFCLVALCTYNLVKPDPDVSTKSAVTEVQIKKTEKQAEIIDTDYQQAMKKMFRENDSLMVAIKSTKESLFKSKQKVTVLQDKVLELAQKTKIELDTVEKMVLCDSLQNKVVNLIEQFSERDSLCDNTITDLTVLLGDKDTTIAVCNQSYLSMKNLLDNSVDQQRNLSDELNNTSKKLRRKTVQNRLLSAGLLVISGITTTLILQRKP